MIAGAIQARGRPTRSAARRPASVEPQHARRALPAGDREADARSRRSSSAPRSSPRSRMLDLVLRLRRQPAADLSRPGCSRPATPTASQRPGERRLGPLGDSRTRWPEWDPRTSTQRRELDGELAERRRVRVKLPQGRHGPSRGDRARARAPAGHRVPAPGRPRRATSISSSRAAPGRQVTHRLYVDGPGLRSVPLVA